MDRAERRAQGVDAGYEEAADASDYELLERMFASRRGEEIEALYEGETDGHPSHSEADLALASHLAWWTGYDRKRADFVANVESFRMTCVVLIQVDAENE